MINYPKTIEEAEAIAQPRASRRLQRLVMPQHKIEHMNEIVNKARRLAQRAHAGQTDKAGRPYIEHVARVAARVHFWPEAEAVAWLHDVTEDHPDYLHAVYEQFPMRIARACGVLDRNRTPNGANYYERIQGNTLAFVVKLADIHDNSNEKRLSALDDKTAARLRRKYERAKEALGGITPEFSGERSESAATTCWADYGGTMNITDWNSRDTLPRDGTRVRILWSNGKEDLGHFEPIQDEVSRKHYAEVAPECLEIGGEWSTDYGNADGAGPDPVGWIPLSHNA